MKCPIRTPKVNSQIKVISEGLSVNRVSENMENVAVNVLNYNNGHTLDKTPTGEKSKLFKDLKDIYGSENQAIVKKAELYLQPFTLEYGAWFEDSVEPSITYIQNQPVIEFPNGEFRSLFSSNEKGMSSKTSLPENKTKNMKDLDKSLMKVVKSLGLEYKSVNEIKDKNGNIVDAVAKADMINMIIEVNEGKKDHTTLPEEVSHFIIELLPKDTNEYRTIFRNLEGWSEYDKYYSEYSDEYNNDQEKINKEIAGKRLAAAFNDYNKTKSEAKKGFINTIINYLGSVLKKFKMFIPDSMVDKYRVNTTNSLNQVTQEILSGDILTKLKPLGSLPKEVYYQKTNTQKQDEIDSKLKESNDKYRLNEEGGKHVYEEKDENGNFTKELGESGSSIAERQANRKFNFGNNEFKAIETESGEKLPNFFADKGTVGHAYLESLIISYDKGEDINYNQAREQVKEITKNKLDSSDKEMFELSSDQFYQLKTLSKNIVDRIRKNQKNISGSEKGYRIYPEQLVYNKNTNTPSTIDLLVIYSNGVAEINDFKFKNNFDKKDLSNYDFTKWNIQLDEQKAALKNSYGVESFGKSAVIPIDVSYNFNKEGKLSNKEFKKIRAISTTVDKDKNYLDEVPMLSSEYFENNVSKISQKLTEQILSVQEQMSKDPYNQDLKDNFKRLTNQLRAITFRGDVAAIYRDASVYAENILKIINQDEDSLLKMDENQIKNLKSMFSNYEFVLDNSFEILDQFESENDVSEEVKKQNKELQSNAKRLVSKVNMILENAEMDWLEATTGVNKPLNYDFAVPNFLGKYFDHISASNHPILRSYSDMLSEAKFESNLILDEKLMKLEGYVDGMKSKGSLKSQFDSIIKQDKNGAYRLISKTNENFYKDLEKARENKDSAWIERNMVFDKEAYNKAFERFKERKKLGIQQGSNKFKNKEVDIQQEINKYENDNNPEKNNSAKFKSKFMKKNENHEDKYVTNEYSSLYKSGNKDLIGFYEMFIETSKEYRSDANRRLGADVYKLPYVMKNMLDVMSQDGFSLGEAKRMFLKNMTIKSEDAEFGATNFRNSGRRSIPAMYLDQLEESLTKEEENKVKDELLGTINEETGELYKLNTKDFSIAYEKALKKYAYNKFNKNVSLDLSNVLALMLQAHETYKMRKKIEPKAIRLLENFEKVSTKKRNALGEVISESDKVEKNTEGTDWFRNFIDRDIYGMNSLSKDKLMKIGDQQISRNKAIQKFGTALSYKAIAPNWLLAGTQFANAVVQNRILSKEGIYFDKEDIKKANNVFTLKEKKVAEIWYKLGIAGRDVNDERIKDLTSISLKKKLKSENIYVFFTKTDDMVDKQFLTSMLHSHVIHEGKIKRKSRLTEDQMKEVKSLYDSISVSENGSMSIKGLDNKQMIKELAKFRMKALKGINHLKGTANQDVSGLYSNYLAGQLFGKFRNWIPGTAEARFGKLRYDPVLDVMNVGRYNVGLGELYNTKDSGKASIVSHGIKQLSLMAAEIASFGLYKKQLSKETAMYYINKARAKDASLNELLSSMDNQDEIINEYIKIREGKYRALISELRFVSLLGLTLLGLGAAVDDDDDNIVLDFLIESNERMFAEASTFVNPNQALSLYERSIPAMQEIVGYFKLLSNTIDEGRDELFGENSDRDQANWFHYTLRTFINQPNFLEDRMYEFTTENDQ